MSGDKWERVNTEIGRRPSEPVAYTDRLKVPGGWLYRCIVKTVKAQSQYGEEISLCFVPDPPKEKGWDDVMAWTIEDFGDTPRVAGLYPTHFEEEFLARQDSWLEGVGPDVLALSVTDLRDMKLLSTRAWNPLIRAQVRSVRDLARIPDSYLLKLKNFGRISLKDVRFALARLGFTRPINEGLWNGRIPDHHRNWALPRRKTKVEVSDD